MCNHPQISWVGLADGIHCGQCGAKIEPGASAPSGKIPEPVKPGPKPETEPVEEKTKKAPKKGGRK
jgi:hypothetical protein